MGVRATIREMYSRYRLPMVVTENGLGAYDKLTEDGKVHDQYRINYLRDHIEQVRLAITDGAEMMGYPYLLRGIFGGPGSGKPGLGIPGPKGRTWKIRT